MSKGVIPTVEELSLRMWAECIRAGDDKGIKWKDTAKSILWASDEIERLKKDTEYLEQKLEKCKEVLRFYGGEWETDKMVCTDIELDQGDKARTLLKELEETEDKDG